MGSYECTCANGKYDRALDMCSTGGTSGGGIGAVTLTFIIILTTGVVAGAGYALYKYRLRVRSHRALSVTQRALSVNPGSS